jgi:hypothetical protein
MKQRYYHELKRLKGKYLHYFLTGFVDGEGSFNVSIVPHPTARRRWIVNPKFQVYQHEKHPEILEIFQELFRSGTIRKKSGSNVLVFEIASRRTLEEKVIPFFRRYPLATKRDAFEKFKRIIEMMSRKEHLTDEGFRRIVRIAHDMNQQGKGRKWSIDDKLNQSASTESSETTRRTRATTKSVGGKI